MLEQLDEINDFDFYNLVRDEDAAILFAQRLGLVRESILCCSKEMTLRKNNGVKNNGYYFRCNVRGCRKEISIRKGTFFEGSHLSFSQTLLFIYFFVNNETFFEQLKRKRRITSDATIVEWLTSCREVYSQYFIIHPTMLGGIGRVVEVDKMALVRQNYNRGRIVRTQWVFGGYDVIEKIGFLVKLSDCT
ncbi:hypothetical protein H312_00798 [Anncaliia algerae PRA339]|uniref:Uncharacterized protein n=1 Tax=Anncaliia algerae PRA339 TaxID=1288291 RepID=A0A059F396_9MICR|nr:hypothetical protein H312_00798 [Anncaliia algerae PRA339]